jgi:ribosome-binding protein aMBF1 (putative translation factor)
MAQTRTVADWMREKGMSPAALIESSGLDRRVVEAIAHGRYTPSPQERLRLSAALQVNLDQVAWGHQTPVAHVYGHGPQFGRSP